MGRFSQKLAAAFPSSSITWVDDPIPFSCQEFRQRLFVRNRGHAVAQNNQFLLFAGSRSWQKLREDFLFKAGSEHGSGHYLLSVRVQEITVHNLSEQSARLMVLD